MKRTQRKQNDNNTQLTLGLAFFFLCTCFFLRGIMPLIAHWKLADSVQSLNYLFCPPPLSLHTHTNTHVCVCVCVHIHTYTYTGKQEGLLLIIQEMQHRRRLVYLLKQNCLIGLGDGCSQVIFTQSGRHEREIVPIKGRAVHALYLLHGVASRIQQQRTPVLLFRHALRCH